MTIIYAQWIDVSEASVRIRIVRAMTTTSVLWTIVMRKQANVCLEQNNVMILTSALSTDARKSTENVYIVHVRARTTIRVLSIYVRRTVVVGLNRLQIAVASTPIVETRMSVLPIRAIRQRIDVNTR